MINPFPIFKSIFNHLLIPKKVPIDIGDIHSFIDNEKYPEELFEFGLPRIYRLPIAQKEGWEIVVGRDKYKKPIHYYDKNYELILVCRRKNG